MIAMLRLQFIIFSLIGIGFVTRKKGIVSREGQRSITDLVINVVLPCNIVTSFVQELPDSALRDCAMIFLISVGMEAMCMLYSRIAYRNVEANKQKCLTYGILVSNAGFLGNPVAEGVYGPMGLMLASVYLIPVRVIMWTKGNRDLQRRIRPPSNPAQSSDPPCVIACMIGIVIMLADLLAGISIVPEWLFDMLKTVGRCNTGLSMMVIGMILSDIDMEQLMDKLVIRYTLERLVVIPGILGMILFGLSRLGVVTGLAPNLAVLLAAMPAPATTSMLSSKYNCAPDFATKMVILSTLCSIPTIFLWGLLLKASG